MASVYVMTYCRSLASKQNQTLINMAVNKMLDFLSSANI